jgi:hypothetical protein
LSVLFCQTLTVVNHIRSCRDRFLVLTEITLTVGVMYNFIFEYQNQVSFSTTCF